jgi:hypothetical protein
MADADGVRREVEHLVHPLVQQALDAFWAKHSRTRLAAGEIPLF